MTTRHAQAMNSHSAHHDVFISYVEHLSRLSQERPGDRALVTVNAQGETILDYATLERRSRALASELQQRFPVGERALILLDNDEHYVVAFLACLYAGVIAVPVFPAGVGQAAAFGSSFCHRRRFSGCLCAHFFGGDRAGRCGGEGLR